MDTYWKTDSYQKMPNKLTNIVIEYRSIDKPTKWQNDQLTYLKTDRDQRTNQQLLKTTHEAYQCSNWIN